MDETTFKIVDGLSRSLGMQLSIRELTKQISKIHGSAYYANVYNRLRSLSEEGIVSLTKAGKSSLVSLNFGNYLILDLLAEMELTKKHELLKKREGLRPLLGGIEEACRNLYLISSVCLIDPERNMSLNRAELLVLFQKPIEESRNDAEAIRKTILNLQAMYNIRVDYLMLDKGEFLQLLSSEEANPLTEMLANKLAFFSPQSFWALIRGASEKGFRIKFARESTDPARLSEQELACNLARYGYKEFGAEAGQGKDVCIEYVVTSLLMRRNARRSEAIPVILVKNQPNYDLLIFLSQKYGTSGKLLGLLKALDKVRSTKAVKRAIGTLEDMEVRAIRASQSSIKERMRLYNAVR